MSKRTHPAQRRRDIFNFPPAPLHKGPGDSHAQLCREILAGVRYFWSRPHRVGTHAAACNYVNPTAP